ncbi:hypothetical protein QQF64_034318 [Cirrhinus molitorella]|uniref:Uncharacterized protein n=1 Tax=Cirrhinus molitorella TaxID=172907 RepID=A0ABR3L4Y9_9TELE
MDQQVQEKANTQTEGSRGKEKNHQRSAQNGRYLPPNLHLLVLLQKLEPQRSCTSPRGHLQKDNLEMKRKKKARLEQERAMVEANLEALELEKEAAAALAEAEVLEAAAMERDDNRSEIKQTFITCDFNEN